MVLPASSFSAIAKRSYHLSSSCRHYWKFPFSSSCRYYRSSYLSCFLLKWTLKKQQPPAPQQTVISKRTLTTMASKETSASKATTTSVHYERHQSDDSYEKAYFYEPGEYMEHLSNLVQTTLGIIDDKTTSNTNNTTEKNRILDIGGGTGNFARSLLSITDDNPNNDDDQKKKQKHEIIVVDPFLEPTAATSTGNDNKSSDDNGAILFVKEPAEAFLQPKKEGEWWRENISQILLKEVVHHLDNRIDIFQGMYNDLNNNIESTTMIIPSILIITRPQIDIDYPLWEDARNVWSKNQPSSTQLMEELQEVGFINVQSKIESYPCTIPLREWQSMIQNRFWSTFSNFNDEQLFDASTKQIPIEWKDRIDEKGILHFEDRLVFITAQKTVGRK